MMGLTPRQRDLLTFIAGYQRAHNGVSPSFEEMREALGLRRMFTVNWLLEALEERGFVRRRRNRARAIEILAMPGAVRGLRHIPAGAGGSGSEPPTAYTGRYPIREHRTCAEWFAEDARAA